MLMNLRWCTSRVLLIGLLWLTPGCPRKGDSGESGRSTPPQEAPCVLLVTLDSTRAERLSCYGHSVATTPNLDELASEGVRFDLAIAQAGSTPVSHASILTGLNPYQHGVRVVYAKSGYLLPGIVPTLATVLRDAGWRTGGFVSSLTVGGLYGLDQGFETFDAGPAKAVDGVMRPSEPAGFYTWDVAAHQRRSDETVDQAVAWLREAGRPFFLWVHLWDTHDTELLPPQDVVDRFVPHGASGPEYQSKVYDAELFYMDAQFGRLLATLKQAGVYDRTIIAVVADHGLGLEDGVRRHGWWRHRLLYQEQIRVPLIMRLPDGPRGHVVADLVRSVDIYPTLLKAAGLKAPQPVAGRSLQGLLAGKQESPRFAYADQLNQWDLNAALVADRPQDALLYVMMDRSWKLIYHANDPAASELYCLDDDPQETRNLYLESPTHVRRLLERLDKVDPFVTEPFPETADGSGLDPAVLEQLQSLGYVGGASDDGS